MIGIIERRGARKRAKNCWLAFKKAIEDAPEGTYPCEIVSFKSRFSTAPHDVERSIWPETGPALYSGNKAEAIKIGRELRDWSKNHPS